MAKDKVAEATIELSVSGLGQVRSQLTEVNRLAEKVGSSGKLKKATPVKGPGGVSLDGGGAGGGAGEASAGGGVGKLMAGAGPAALAVGAALAAVAAAAAAAAVAVKTVVSLLKTADPTRFAVLNAKFETASVILGRAFIPLLQVAVRAMDRVNAVLRTTSGGGLSKVVMAVATTLDRIVNKLMPMFAAYVEVQDRHFGRLLPAVEAFGDIIEDIVDAFAAADIEGNFLQPWSDWAAEAVSQLTEIGKLAWGVFGPVFRESILYAVAVTGQLFRVMQKGLEAGRLIATTIRDAFRAALVGVVSVLNTVIEYLNKVIDAINQVLSYEFALRGGEGTVPQIGRIGKYREPDFGDDGRPAPRRRTAPGLDNNPLQYVKPEFVGLEEAFRKANTSGFDPAKEAERERKRQTDTLISGVQQIVTNTTPRPMAEVAF